MKKFIARLKTAHRFNEPQIQAAGLFTIGNLLAVASKDNVPWWMWVVAALLWPSVSYIANLILGAPPKVPTSKESTKVPYE